MAQILRLENPLFNRHLHLTLPQRLCSWLTRFPNRASHERLLAFVVTPELHQPPEPNTSKNWVLIELRRPAQIQQRQPASLEKMLALD